MKDTRRSSALFLWAAVLHLAACSGGGNSGAPAVSIQAQILPNGERNQVYASTFSATGGTPPYSYAVTAGALPGGMSIRGLTEFGADALPRYWVINELPKRLESLVREGLPDAGFLDLTPSFSEKAKRGSLLYLVYDSHWSPEGHRVAAAAIASFLTRWE